MILPFDRRYSCGQITNNDVRTGASDTTSNLPLTAPIFIKANPVFPWRRRMSAIENPHLNIKP